MDTVDVELTVRMVSIPIEKTIQPNPWCFCHGVGPLFHSLHYKGKYRHTKNKISRLQHGTMDMLCPTFQPNTNLNEDAPW